MPPTTADNELANRIRTVLEQHGGAYRFAVVAGVASQTLYNAMKTGNSALTIKAIAAHCPDVDLTWLLTGEPRSSEPGNVLPPRGRSAVLQHVFAKAVAGELKLLKAIGLTDEAAELEAAWRADQ